LRWRQNSVRFEGFAQGFCCAAIANVHMRQLLNLLGARLSG
jgi:hypothetical protein